MSRKRDHLERYIAVGVLFCAVCLVFIARLINIQIAGQDYYTEGLRTKSYTRTVKIQAQRGCIYDRNGKPLVTNTYTYDMFLDAGSIGYTNEEKNKTILNVLEVADKMGESGGFTLPDFAFDENDGERSFKQDYLTTVYGRRLIKLVKDMNFKPDEVSDDGEEKWESKTVGDIFKALRVRYGFTDKDGKDNFYSKEDEELLFRVRLDMEVHNFSTVEPYTILENVSKKLISAATEGNVRGLGVSCKAERVYNYPGLASHMLGRTGKIMAENADYYTEQGYNLDAIVGISGAEKSFEKYLHGEDGTLVIVEDEYGNTVDQYVHKEPVPGQDVYLSIDIDLQKSAEEALANNIELIVSNAQKNGGELSGEDANAGALSLVERKTGAVLALATYPTYNLVTFNEDYKELAADTENTPLLFRALDGIYTPGSTFKPGVAMAALQEGVITPYTEIYDSGVYDYYADVGFTLPCWIHAARYGYQHHGSINVSEAIQVSCNYFFCDIGRQLTISKMNAYCKSYGLGQPTGIELDEKVGRLAGPADRESGGGTWYAGDTCQAAIGQSDNMFTPLQISMYIATLLNGGERIGAHLLYEVRDYHGNVTYTAEPEILDSSPLSADNVTTIRYAMKDVTENGSAARVFANYPITIGGKTGTAQGGKSNSSDNALFTAFAPFDDPEIVATSVIEHGANGTDAGFAIRDVFSSYFGLNNNNPGNED